MRSNTALRTLRCSPSAALALALLAGGCAGNDKDAGPSDTPTHDTDTDTDTTTTTATDTAAPPLDTSYDPADVGSLMLVQDENRTALYAVFVNQQPGYENLAYCAATDTVCLPAFPSSIDTAEPFDPSLRFDPVFSQYRYVGDSITFGPWTADLRYDAERGIAYYYANLTGEDIPLGPQGVSWGVQWGDYEGTDDLTLREPIELVAPRNQTVPTTNASFLPIEWTPQADGGEIHLFASVGDPLFIGRQWILEDDGYFEIPIDDVFAGAPPSDSQTIDFVLQRWNRDTTTFHGNTLELIQQSSATFSASYDYVGSATEIEPSDNCAEAVNNVDVDQVGTYSFWGRLGGYTFDMPLQCGGGGFDSDALITVEMPPLTMVAATYTLPAADSDAAIWVTDDCSAQDACLAASDVNAETLPESVQTFNPSTTDTVQRYLVLTGVGTQEGIFTLDVSMEQLLTPDLADQCLEAQQKVTGLQPGTYYSEETAFLGELDPGLACTNSQTPGPDAIGLVVLPQGKTLTASIQMPGGDPAIYLMTNCVNPVCTEGADVSIGPNEQLVHVNTSAVGEERLYLVIDTKGSSLKPYFLTIDFQ